MLPCLFWLFCPSFELWLRRWKKERRKKKERTFSSTRPVGFAAGKKLGFVSEHWGEIRVSTVNRLTGYDGYRILTSHNRLGNFNHSYNRLRKFLKLSFIMTTFRPFLSLQTSFRPVESFFNFKLFNTCYRLVSNWVFKPTSNYYSWYVTLGFI